MSQVVFIRAANVGGHQTFRPSILAKALAHLGAVSLGAAGTLVVRKKISRTALRLEILGQLKFKPELLILPGAEVIELFESKPFGSHIATKAEREFLTVVQQAPTKIPPLQFQQPPGDDWQVKILEIRGRCVLSLWRPRVEDLLYPNQVIEKWLKLPATTRSWNTVASICKTLGKPD